MSDIVDLLEIPELKIIEEVNYETNKQRLMALILAIAPDVNLYETTDQMVLLEAFAYEITYRDAVFNERMRAALPSLGSGENLDTSCLNFYGTERLDRESDAAFYSRSMASLEEYAVTGTIDAYISNIKKLDVRITHLYPYRSGEGEMTAVWYSNIEGDAEELALLHATIEQRIVESDLRSLCATSQSVVMATEVSFDISAVLQVDSVFREADVIESATVILREYFATLQIAQEINMSKLMSLMHIEHVAKVTLNTPIEDIVIGDEQIAVCNDIILTATGVIDV